MEVIAANDSSETLSSKLLLTFHFQCLSGRTCNRALLVRSKRADHCCSDSGDAFSHVNHALSVLHSLDFQNSWSEVLETTWGQATVSGDSTENAFLIKHKNSRFDLFADSYDHRAASCNHPDVGFRQTCRKRRHLKERASSRVLQSSNDDGSNEEYSDTNIDKDLSDHGLNNDSVLDITCDLWLSVRRASVSVARELQNNTNGKDTLWFRSAPSHAAQQRGRLSTVYATILRNRCGLQGTPRPSHKYCMALFGLALNAFAGHAASWNLCFSTATSTRRQLSARAHVHCTDHVPAWQRNSLWSKSSGRRGSLPGIALDVVDRSAR